jgi:MFS transporter, DHA3 family, macrolide efflux protein
MTASIWRYPRFVLYALGGMINSIGNSIYSIALPLMVFHLTKSAIDMTVMAVCETVPRSLIGLFVVGPLVDRLSRRVVLISSLLFQAVCSVLIATCNSTGLLQIWMLYLVGALIATAHEFVRSADFAVIPAMFGDRKMEAMSGLQSTFRLAIIIGPVLASFLLAMTSYSTLLWINAVTYLGPIVMCIWTRVPHEKLGGVRSFRQVAVDLREGLLYIKGNRVLVRMISVSALSNLALGGVGTVMIYHMKHQYELPDQTISWYLTLSSVGSLVSSLLSPRFAHIDKGKLIRIGLTINTLSVAVYLLPVFWIVPVALVASGLGNLLFVIAYSVMVQEMTTNEMLGRVGSATRMIEFFSIGISTSMLGFITAHIGAEGAFACTLVLSVLPLLVVARGMRSEKLSAGRMVGYEESR